MELCFIGKYGVSFRVNLLDFFCPVKSFISSSCFFPSIRTPHRASPLSFYPFLMQSFVISTLSHTNFLSPFPVVSKLIFEYSFLFFSHLARVFSLWRFIYIPLRSDDISILLASIVFVVLFCFELYLLLGKACSSLRDSSLDLMCVFLVTGALKLDFCAIILFFIIIIIIINFLLEDIVRDSDLCHIHYLGYLEIWLLFF